MAIPLREVREMTNEYIHNSCSDLPIKSGSTIRKDEEEEKQGGDQRG